MTAATGRLTQRFLTARFPSEVLQPVLRAVSTAWSKLRRGWPWAPWPHRDGASSVQLGAPQGPQERLHTASTLSEAATLASWWGGGVGPTKACPPETWEGVQADGVRPVRQLRTQLPPLSLSFLVRDGNQQSPGTGLPSPTSAGWGAVSCPAGDPGTPRGEQALGGAGPWSPGLAGLPGVRPVLGPSLVMLRGPQARTARPDGTSAPNLLAVPGTQEHCACQLGCQPEPNYLICTNSHAINTRCLK